jgi:hypothetical protein
LRKRTFINLTNHPTATWSEKQLCAAREYGEVLDIPFPEVDPTWTTIQVIERAKSLVDEVLLLNPIMVLCQGEFTLTYHLVKAFKEKNISVVNASSKRAVEETRDVDGMNRRKYYFDFVQFREY